jgi:hypothetical protein
MNIKTQLKNLDWESIAAFDDYRVWKFSADKFGVQTPTGKRFFFDLETMIHVLENRIA